jgi:hypothetical protein
LSRVRERASAERRKRTCSRKIEFKDRESEESGEVVEKELCDDIELDYADTFDTTICSVCGEFGRDGELWCRRVRCVDWTHSVTQIVVDGTLQRTVPVICSSRKRNARRSKFKSLAWRTCCSS